MTERVGVLTKRVLLLLILLAGMFGCCLLGCDRMTRYKVLTFFFEGVPSPDGKYPGAEPNIVTVRNVDRINAKNANAMATNADQWGQRLSSRHDFVKECDKCHLGDLRSGRQELKKPVPNLCYSCHTDLHQAGDYLHGPLNVGECVFCHDPHQSTYIHLQKAPQPDLCYRCHQRQDIEVVPGHQELLEKVCTDCHDPHGGPTLQFLKASREHEKDPNRIDLEKIE